MFTPSSIARQREYLDQLQHILPPSEPWEAWLERTGELPPDFDVLPAVPGLPDPLVQKAGEKQVPVTTPQEWRARREELLNLFHHWVLGRVPPPPENLQARVLREQHEPGATARQVELTFGPQGRARLWLELLLPPGDGPFPVFMTQHNHRGWALIALRRGYAACIYAGADSRDDTDTFCAAYPEYDWSRLTRRAWAASRCIDYLATVSQADENRVALAGHSRNGKQSLIASAMDGRIAVVISSSSGAGGDMTARLDSEQHCGEGIELLTRVFPDWFHPRLRFFVGREQYLPVDMHELVALSAPRPCLLSVAINDGVSSTWATQQTYLSAQRVYRLLEAEDRLRILWRPGSHETWTTIIERYLDWCDATLRPDKGTSTFPERLIHPWNWEAWREESGETTDLTRYPLPSGADMLSPGDGAALRGTADWRSRRTQVCAAVRHMLGQEPPSARGPQSDYGQEASHIAALLDRDQAAPAVEKEQMAFGEYVAGDVYVPAGLRESGRRVPAVLWLHSWSFPTGYVAAYRRERGGPARGKAYLRLALAGYAVFCYDQIGCGRRVQEAEHFYARHSRWSLLGKMVRDAQAALDALAELPYVDAEQIWAVGFGLGGMIGLHLGALDERLAGLATVCGPSPFRLDTADKGGLERWSQQTMLLPRLGLFLGQEARVPYDVSHLLACLAPRPVLVLSPQLDREAPLEDVTHAVDQARQVYTLYGAADRLAQVAPEDYAHLGPEMQALVVHWLHDVAPTE
jgi:hypothetical protein